MSRTSIDIDDEALKAAMRALATTTKKDTVNTALREYVRSRRQLTDSLDRAAALDQFAEHAANGDYDQAADAYFAEMDAVKKIWAQVPVDPPTVA